MASKRPRIADVDYLDPQAVLAGHHEGDWVRVPMYQKAHRVGKAGDTARCGHPLLADSEWWEKWRAYMAAAFDADPGELYVALDRRTEASHCKTCANGRADWSWEEERKPTPLPVTHMRPASGLTPAQRLQQRRFEQATQRVAREFGATTVL